MNLMQEKSWKCPNEKNLFLHLGKLLVVRPMTDNELLGAQWMKAAQLLGIECISPFFLEGAEGKRFEFAALISGFGAERGTLLAVAFDREAVSESKRQGYTFSSMGPETRLEFETESYKECLRDWGWAKHEPPPPWYSGNEV